MAELVEGARLESGYMGNCVVGSNPTLSATKKEKTPYCTEFI